MADMAGSQGEVHGEHVQNFVERYRFDTAINHGAPSQVRVSPEILAFLAEHGEVCAPLLLFYWSTDCGCRMETRCRSCRL
jgi:hypothetical protein